MKVWVFGAACLAAVWGMIGGEARAQQAVDEVRQHPPIPLLDEDGVHVLESGRPYSPRQSCGGCHDYDKITHAYHFETGRDEASDDFGALRGLPHLVSPGYFGGYACMGGSNPEVLAKKANARVEDFADRGTAGWIQRCINCHAGGGWMEKDRQGRRYDQVDPATVADLDGDYFNRGTDADNRPADVDTVARWDWVKSGVVENDCLLCHAPYERLTRFDPLLPESKRPYDHFRSLRGDLARAGLFRFVDTAILDFLDVDGQPLVRFQRRADDAPHGPGYALVLDEAGAPVIQWNADAFDADGKVSLPLRRFPANDNCMQCHRTSNSRRGFYGFGDRARLELGEDGTLVDDYQDDVHKGKTWTEANGETRQIENCNACHARNYYRPAHANVELDASHDFLKGNSDMDVRNDLDYADGGPKSCRYCHDRADNPALPSGHDNALDAHLERWKASGDLQGYPRDRLRAITQRHLDVIACQTCHITGKKRRGRELTILYRYRTDEDGRLRITPYNPRLRYYWKDRTTGRVLTRHERNRVYQLREDENGQPYGVIVHPDSGEVLARVSARRSHGSWRFGEPEDAAGYRALKTAYDALLADLGVTEPDAVMVWTESNEYLLSHNTRPAVASVQCGECHARKQDGAFSALVAADGILGEGRAKTVTRLPDPALVAEGIVELELPYMKVMEDGTVRETVADILYHTKIDPSMTRLDAERAPAAGGALKPLSAARARALLGWESGPAETADLWIYRPRYGDGALRQVAVALPRDALTDALAPRLRWDLRLGDGAAAGAALRAAGLGRLRGPVIDIRARSDGRPETTLPRPLILRLPHQARAGEPVQVVRAGDDGQWRPLPAEALLQTAPADETGPGHVLVRSDGPGRFAVTVAVQATGDDAHNADESGGPGLGAAPHLALLAGLALVLRRRRR